MTGPDIIEDEVEEVIRKIKAGKIRGEDLGAMKMMQRNLALEITSTANQIYNSEEISGDNYKSVFLFVPKRAGILENNNHRTTSVMS